MFFSRLININRDSKQIADISPLESLTELEMLGLGNKQMSDLSPLLGITNLVQVNLKSKQIADMTTDVFAKKLAQKTLV